MNTRNTIESVTRYLEEHADLEHVATVIVALATTGYEGKITGVTGTALDALLNLVDAAVDADEDDGYCNVCAGTGIGQHGDPDTSRCTSCGGRGQQKREDFDNDDPPEAPEYSHGRDADFVR